MSPRNNKFGFSKSDNEAKILKSRLDTYLNTMGCAVLRLIYDENLTVVEANPCFFEMIGYTPQQFKVEKNNKLLNVVPTEKWNETLFSIRKSYMTPSVGDLRGENILIHRNGNLVNVLITGRHVEENGRNYIYITMTDISELREAERENKELRVAYQAITENSPSGLVKMHFNEYDYLVPFYINKGLATMLCMSKRDTTKLYGHDFLEILHPMDRERIIKSFREILTTGIDSHETYRLRKSNGDYIWAQATASLKDEDGKKIFYVAFLDISDRMILQDKQYQKAEALKIAVSHVGMQYFEYNILTHAATSIDKKSIERFKLGFPITDFPSSFIRAGYVYKADIKQFKQAFINIDNGSMYEEFEARIYISDEKQWLWQHIRCTVLTNSNGNHIKAVCTSENIDSYKTSEKEFITAFSNHEIQAWKYYLKTKTLYSAYDMFKRFGIDQNQITNVPESIIERKTVHPYDAEKHRELFRRLESGESPVSIDARIYDRDKKSYRWTRIVYSLIETADGNKSEAIGSAMDVTEEYELRTRHENMIRLHKSNKSKNTLFSAYSILNSNIMLEIDDAAGLGFDKWNHNSRKQFYDMVMSKIVGYKNRAEAKDFFAPDKLITAYQQGETIFNFPCKLQLNQNDVVRYVNFKIELTLDSANKKIMDFVSLTDVSQQYVLEQMMEKNVESGFEFLLAINIKTDRLVEALGTPLPQALDIYNRPYSELGLEIAKACNFNPSSQECLDVFSFERINELLKTEENITRTFIKEVNGTIKINRLRVFYIEKEMGIIGIANSDITDSVKEKQELLMLLLNLVEIVCVVDSKTGQYTKHTVETVANSLSAITGESFEQHCRDLAAKYDSEKINNLYLKELDIQTMERMLEDNPDGYTITHEKSCHDDDSIKMYKIIWVDDNHRYIGILRTDITKVEMNSRLQKKNLQEALELAKQANDAKSDFLATMSHDIRTPMNAIMGMTDLAMMELEGNPSVRNDLLCIKNSSIQLLNLINDILEMSRIESGKFTISKESFNITVENDMAIQQYESYANTEGIKFVHSFTHEHEKFIGDALKIHRVVDNLLSNAFKFTPKGGTVTFDLTEVPTENPKISSLRITIADNGIGMSQETIANIFEPFYMVEKPHAKLGTGLGLSIVKRIVEYSDGTINVQSLPSNGSTFTVTIPVMIDEDSHSKINEAPINDLDKLIGKKVLVCEDHPVNQTVAKRLLEKVGIEVAITSNGKEGLDFFNASPANTFDAILMDIKMPVMDGLEASSAIRELNKADAQSIPIIAMTANAFTEDREASLAAGINAHLSKPIEPKKLYKTLIKHIN